MRILQIIPAFGCGGAERMCENLVYALQRMGNHVAVISLYNQHTTIASEIEKHGVKIYFLDKKKGFEPKIIGKIAKIIINEQPDVIHTHLDTEKYAVFAKKKAKFNGVVVHTIHNVAEKESCGISARINRYFFRHGLCVPVALSPEIQNTVVSYYKISKEKVPFVFNGIDMSRCLVKKEYKLHNPIIFTHVGRFVEQKNHKLLVEIFERIHKRFPDTILQLVGEGELKRDTINLVEQKGLEKSVLFLGHQENVYPILNNTDIFILPSSFEGVPMSLIEAMGCALPIISTKVGGIPDMIDNGQNGILVPCDIDSIFSACVNLIEDDKKREMLGKNALIKSENFSSWYMAKRYCEIYNDVLHKK